MRRGTRTAAEFRKSPFGFWRVRAAAATATALSDPLDLMRATYAAAGVAGVVSDATRAGATGSFGAWKVIRDVASVALRRAFGIVRRDGADAARIVPYAGISFATFETRKSRYNAARPPRRRRAGNPSIAPPRRTCPRRAAERFGGAAGLRAIGAPYPLDIVRRRVQVMGRAGGCASPWRALVDIARAEGLVGGCIRGSP